MRDEWAQIRQFIYCSISTSLYCLNLLAPAPFLIQLRRKEKIWGASNSVCCTFGLHFMRDEWAQIRQFIYCSISTSSLSEFNCSSSFPFYSLLCFNSKLTKDKICSVFNIIFWHAQLLIIQLLQQWYHLALQGILQDMHMVHLIQSMHILLSVPLNLLVLFHLLCIICYVLNF